MDVNKNTYIFGFAAIMVVLVASLLSTAAISLKPLQDINIEAEKKQNILTTLGIEVTREEAADIYKQKITNSYVIDDKGQVVDGDAFTIDLGKELKKDKSEQVFPVFESEDNGSTSYIIPLRGKGLWGPIWGYLALKDDMSTISGAVFDHKSETPGLGAEISLSWFQEPFIGKQLFDGTEFKSVTVVKGGASEDDMHGVDGISGGTITADGVTDMLQERLTNYLPFMMAKMNTIQELEVDSTLSDTTAIYTLNNLQ